MKKDSYVSIFSDYRYTILSVVKCSCKHCYVSDRIRPGEGIWPFYFIHHMAYSTFFSFRIFAEKLLATKTSPVDVEHICVGIYPTSRFLIIFGLSFFKHFCVLSLFQNLKYPIDPRPHSHSMSYYSKHTQVCIPFIPIISELFALVQQAQYYLVGVWWQKDKDLYFVCSLVLERRNFPTPI